ncbi:MAG: helix-turn-helix domain-containing protein [Burkholderiales bacterium]|nr:MAG: helix-turn-helix domain-containing protein [Burkholderiales bacterium]
MTTLQTFPIQSPAQLSVHIKSLRKARGLTQTALGERIGVKQVRLADIENNPASVSLDQLLQVLHALDARLLLADTHTYAATMPAAPLTVRTPATDW